MSNQYDELKNLLDVSRNMLSKNDLTESRKVLKRNGLISEQEVDDDGATNIDSRFGTRNRYPNHT